MKLKAHFTALAATLAVLTMIGTAAIAQPDPNNNPKEDNPVNHPFGVPAARGGAAGAAAGAGGQRAAIAERLRAQLVRIGVTDATQQDAILGFINSEIQARGALMAKGRDFSNSLRDDAVDDKQVATLLNDYDASLDDDAARHAKALAALKAQIDFPTHPKVEAFLTLLGLVGNGPSVLMNIFGGMTRQRPVAGTPNAGAADGNAAPAVPRNGGIDGAGARPQNGNQPLILTPGL